MLISEASGLKAAFRLKWLMKQTLKQQDKHYYLSILYFVLCVYVYVWNCAFICKEFLLSYKPHHLNISQFSQNPIYCR